MTEAALVSVRYMVDDVQVAIDFYTAHLGFALHTNAAPAFADVTRGNLRLLLAGPGSSAGRAMPDGAVPGPGGWNRIHLIVDDIVTGPGGQQILVQDPAGNLIELFQPASHA